MTSGGGGPLAVADFIFHFFRAFLSSSHFTPHLQIGFHFSQKQPEEGWRGMERAASRGL